MVWPGNRICFVFVDGIGLAPAAPANPFSAGTMAGLENKIGEPILSGLSVRRPGCLARGIDATMGVPGLPQSATGQTALFTGINAARLCDGHMPAFPGKTLTAAINEDNILKRAALAGIPVTFANAYSQNYFDEVAADARAPSATTLSVMAAGIPFRMLEDLVAGRAVYWDITGAMIETRTGREDVPQTEPEEAARHLADLARDHGLVLYETFMTDMLGHKGRVAEARDFLVILDRFLAVLADAVVADGGTLVVTSDHGNIEDCATRAHTTNPVPLIVMGPQSDMFAGVRSIMDVPGCIWRCFARGVDLQDCTKTGF